MAALFSFALCFLLCGAALASSDVRFESGRIKGVPLGGSFDFVESEACPLLRGPSELKLTGRCEYLHGTYEQTEFALHREREASYVFLVQDVGATEGAED